ncbi:hypothetical protein SAMN04488690_2623 [Stenotrophomonas indicatrix]|uniref:Uncharacterized protein n=1 Tax=Stenotrophomonas indicatrix TaxID=2045451 RepID=A0A1W1GZX6_9GAMM|nr:hypothetical protein SAMN04488690_2623 [Stenotrophomonas indicatrix]
MPAEVTSVRGSSTLLQEVGESGQADSLPIWAFGTTENGAPGEIEEPFIGPSGEPARAFQTAAHHLRYLQQPTTVVFLPQNVAEEEQPCVGHARFLSVLLMVPQSTAPVVLELCAMRRIAVCRATPRKMDVEPRPSMAAWPSRAGLSAEGCRALIEYGTPYWPSTASLLGCFVFGLGRGAVLTWWKRELSPLARGQCNWAPRGDY